MREYIAHGCASKSTYRMGVKYYGLCENVRAPPALRLYGGGAGHLTPINLGNKMYN